MMVKAHDRAQSSELPSLFHAIIAGDVAQVSQVLDAFPHLAAESAFVGATRQKAAPFYLERIEHYFYAGDTALHVAAAAYQVKIALDLISRGAPVNARNRMGAEPLHYACDGSPGSKRWNPAAQASTIECLLAAGANPNATDRNGVTPLHRAVRTRCAAAAVRVLVERGANPRQTNGRGSTPLHLAGRTTGRGGSGSKEAREQQAEIARLLMHVVSHSPNQTP